MRFVFAALVVAIGMSAVACADQPSSDSTPQDRGMLRGPGYATGPDATPRWPTFTPTPTAIPTPTATPYVPPANATPIPRPFECEDHGYAGRADDGNSTVDTYWLTDPPEDPADAKFYVAQSICIAGMWIPPGNVQAWKANYTLRQLEDWYDEARRIAELVPGRNRFNVNQGINRLKFSAGTPRAADLFERLLADTDVPIEAVSIEVADQVRIQEPASSPILAPGLELSLEFDQIAYRSDPISFTVTATNTSGTPFEIQYNPAAPVDIVIFTEDGDQIWRHLWGYVLPARFEQLAPGESVEFVVEWDGLDDFRVPLEPGAYTARAYFEVSILEFRTGGEMSTHPVPFHVLAP